MMSPKKADWLGFACLVASLFAVLLYRRHFIEPREWAVLCAAAAPPAACLPRAALLWLQHFYLWGAAALALGFWAFLGAPFFVSVAGVVVGMAAVVNYNASWGMFGLALAAWGWLTPPASTGAAPETPAPAPPRSR